MSKNIKVFLIDNLNKNKELEETEIEKPKTLEELQLFLEKKMKKIPDYYNLFYIADDKEIKIQNDEQYELFSNNELFIRQVDPKEKAGTLFKKSINKSLIENKNKEDKIDDTEQINQLKEEIKQKDKIIEENKNYIEKICKKLKIILSLIIPEKNLLLENLIKEISSAKILKSYYDIYEKILSEMDTINQYLTKKLNNNSINEENNNKNKKEKIKISKNFDNTHVKKKIISEIKDNKKSSKTEIKKIKNLPYSCIPRIDIEDFPDITYDNLGPK